MLSKDMATVGEYLQTWEVKLSTTKTVSTVLHLTTRKLNESQPQLPDLALLLQA